MDLIFKVTLKMINLMDMVSNWLKVNLHMKVNMKMDYSTVKVSMNQLMEKSSTKELSVMVRNKLTEKIQLL